MRRIRGSVSVGFGLLLLLAAPARAQEEGSPPSAPTQSASATNQQIRADVERASAEAAALFDQANQARDAKDYERALELYRKASELAPSVNHPIRRACSVLARLGRHDEAIAECERAARLAPDSSFNDMAMSDALAARRRAGRCDAGPRARPPRRDRAP